LLDNVVLQDTTDDQWRWRLDVSGSYYVRSVYELLTKDDNITVDAVSGLIWHRNVPLKVSILAWRLLRNRLPTKTNLVARGMIGTDAQLCVSGCGEVETAHHLFVSCPIFRELWSLVRAWIGVCGADLPYVPDHFHQFTLLAGGATFRRSFM